MLADDPHPLVQELASLRKTAARFQHEAHAAALRLQRHSLDTSRLHEHASTLERHNHHLQHELDSLRGSPHSSHHPAVTQVRELTLALRRVSEKIDLTEHTLLKRTNELVDADSELVRARNIADGAYELAARMRAREEASKARERELEFKARASEEERKMVDLVVQEYADLVRNLEGRKSSATPSIPNGSASSVTLVDNLQDGKSSLHRILTEFSTESEKLHATIAELTAQNALLQTTLDAERKSASHDRALLAQAKTELDKLNLEDQTAAKMVSRYMKFSQASTNALQEQITTLKTRHAATTATLDFQLSIAESQLASERAHSSHLQDTLDDLCDDLARESYGRRTEVALRLALLAREEGIAEFMRRWVRRARESYERWYPDSLEPEPEQPTPKSSAEEGVQEAFRRAVCDAESILAALDDEVQFAEATRASGSVARIVMALETVEMLRSELQEEVQKRVEAIRRSAAIAPNGHLHGVDELPPNGSIPSQEDEGMLDRLPITPSNAHATLERELAAPQPENAGSPLSILNPAQESPDDPFVAIPPVVEITEITPQGELTIHPSTDSPSSIPTLLVDEEIKAVQLQQLSPAVSTLDLVQEHSSPVDEVGGSLRVEVGSTTTGRSVDIDANLVHMGDDQDIHAQAEVGHTQVEVEASTASTPTIPPSLTSPSDRSSPSKQPDSITSRDQPDPITPRDQPDSTTPRDQPDSTTPRDQPDSTTPRHRSDSIRRLISDLEGTKHRYDDLERAFRDLSIAIKDLRRALPSTSPGLSPYSSVSHTLSPSSSPYASANANAHSHSTNAHAHTQLRRHLTTALARLSDYFEDARVDLSIHLSDELLTSRGFQTVLSVQSVPGTLANANGHADVESEVAENANEHAEIVKAAKRFVDGSDEGVRKARERFEKKVADLGNDVAVLKRVVHALEVWEGGGSFEMGLRGELGPRDEPSAGGDDMDVSGETNADGSGSGGGGGGWTAWTAGLLGTSTAGRARPRSPGPVQTFGNVMTSPRLRHAASLKQLQVHAQGQGLAPGQGQEGGPLAGLGLRIAGPLPSPSPSPSLLSLPSPGRYPGLGASDAGGQARPRTMSAMYAVGMGVGIGGLGIGGRSSSMSVGLVGMGSSGRRGSVGVSAGMGGGSAGSPLRSSGFSVGHGNGNGDGNGNGNGRETGNAGGSGDGDGGKVYDLSGDVE